MVKESKKTGAELFLEVEESINQTNEELVKQFLYKTVTEIKRRQAWIEARLSQIATLHELQKDAVRAFDKGKFTEGLRKELEAKLGTSTHW